GRAVHRGGAEAGEVGDRAGGVVRADAVGRVLRAGRAGGGAGRAVTVVAGGERLEDARGVPRLDDVLVERRDAAAPRVVDDVRGEVRARVLPVVVGRREDPLAGGERVLVEALALRSRAGLGGHPLRVRRDADAVLAGDRAHGVGAVAVVVARRAAGGAGA